MALKLFPETILLLKVDHFEVILNQIKIDGMVNDHSSSCIIRVSIVWFIRCGSGITNCFKRAFQSPTIVIIDYKIYMKCYAVTLAVTWFS